MDKKFFKLVSVLIFLMWSASSLHAASVELAWDAPVDGGNVAGYIVYWSTVSGSYNDSDSVIVVGETNATISGLDESNTYYFAVKAYNCTGAGNASNEVTVEAYSDAFQDDSSTDSSTDSSSNGNSSSNSRNTGGGGCFIATAAYRSPLDKHVVILREFRDVYLMPSKLGRGLIKMYYRYSPSLANTIERHNTLKILVRGALMPFVALAYVAIHASVIEKIGIMLLVVMLTMGGLIYLRKRIEAKS
jgi:hypothetical protein